MSSETKISLALGAKKRARPAATNGVKRSIASLREDEKDEYVDTVPQKVSHFDTEAGTAIDENSKPKKEALIIKPQANRDWKDASKRRKQHHQLPGQTNGDVVVQEEVKPAPGLHVRRRSQSEDTSMMDGAQDAVQGQSQQQAPEPGPEPGAETSVLKTDDELAIDALLGKTKKSDLTIAAVTEEEAFDQDYHQAPDMATLAEYEKVPVEQFGAAMLRGMGWKEGEGIGSERGKKSVKTKIPERRPALLGIGAKEEAAVAQEMGTWGKAAKDKRGPAVVYNPVLLRDKRTGEMFTEEELEKKKQRLEQDRLDAEFEAKEKERRGRRDDEDDRDRGTSRREKDRRRDRDRRDDRERDRGKYDDSDEEYYRRKREKERRRRERERDDNDHDRERSTRHDREDHRHRDRSRDRRR